MQRIVSTDNNKILSKKTKLLDEENAALENAKSKLKRTENNG